MADVKPGEVNENCCPETGAREPAASYLVMETQGELYAVRLALVRQAGVVSPRDVNTSAGRPRVLTGDGDFPLYYLRELVGQERPDGLAEETAVVFLEENGNSMALAPDRILWKQDADLRRLPQWLKKAPVVTGVIALDSGVAVIVIEPFQTEEECLCREEQWGPAHERG